MIKNILVVTSCTGQKAVHAENQLLLEDFRNKEVKLKREAELAPYMRTAGEMYTGKQHQFLMDGVLRYREEYPDQPHVAVLSAGYGIIDERKEVAPYEVTFNNMTGTKIREWSDFLQITEDTEKLIEKYDLVFFLLGDKYLQAIEWPLKVRDHQKLVFFAGNMSQNRLSVQPNSTLLLLGNQEASLFGGGLIWLKGLLFAQLLDYMAHNGTTTWDDIYADPSLIREILINQVSKEAQLELFEETEKDKQDYLQVVQYVPPLFITDDEIAPNYKSSLSYYMPENDDRVDPGYNFETDEHSPNRTPLEDDLYAHDFFQRANYSPRYDGILISKVNIDKATKRKKTLIEQKGIREFLRLQPTTKIMGDCGAFSYIAQDEPPYQTQEILDYYQSLGFDYGVSVDHLIVGPWMKDEKARMRRYELTIDNAEDFYNRHQTGNYSFEPIGVVQGWDPSSFRKAVEKLMDIGYTYVALGGLAKEKSTVIFEILKEIRPLIKDSNFRMHLFGVFRDMEVMHAFHKLGVTSFDSASPLRRAWMDARHNYYTDSGKTYTALRLPEALEGKGRLKNITDPDLFQQIKRLEQEALHLVRAYGKGEFNDIDAVLEALLAYDAHLGGNRAHHATAYRDLLENRPWEQCRCPICEELGIDVAIFRGNNRNRRRGFHNTHVYYEQLEKLRKELLITPVSQR